MADTIRLPDLPDDDLFGDEGDGGGPKRKRKGGLTAGRGRAGMPTDAPISQLAEAGPAVPQWRVYRIVAGERVYVGLIASEATPEDVIEAFPGDMPPKGQSWKFAFVGVGQDGVDTDATRYFTISGSNPDVIRSRESVEPTERKGSSDERSLSYLERQLQAQLDEIKRERNGLEHMRAQAQSQVVETMQATAKNQQDWLVGMMAAERQRHEAMLAEERDRRAEERRQREEERKEEARRREEERKEREREEIRREEAREKREAAERQERRDHEARMAATAASNTLENTLKTFAPILAVLPMDKLISRALGTDAPATDGGPSTAVALAGVAEKLIEGVSGVAEKHLELQQQIAQRQAPQVKIVPPAPKPPQRQLPQLTPAEIEAAKPKEKVKAEAKPEAKVEEKPKQEKPVNPKLDAIPLAKQRDAKIALRKLGEKLAAEPDQAKWKRKIVAAGIVQPAILPYIKAVGVEAAAIEAGMSEEIAKRLAEEAAKSGVLAD